MRVDDAVVISLPERVDRLRRFFAELPEGWSLPRPRVVPGVVEAPPAYWRVSAGAWGCGQAHVRELRSAFRAGHRSLLVLEDDALFTENFALRWKVFSAAVPGNWSMLMLGGQHMEPPAAAGQVRRCRDTRRTHAYVVRDRAMPDLARTFAQATSHIDHSLREVQSRMPVYAPAQWMVGQRAGLSDISGTTKQERFWLDPVLVGAR